MLKETTNITFIFKSMIQEDVENLIEITWNTEQNKQNKSIKE